MRDKLINKMAEAIFNKVGFCGFSDREARIVAEAALDALLGELREYTSLKYGSRMLESEREMLGNNILYQQLLDMRK